MTEANFCSLLLYLAAAQIFKDMSNPVARMLRAAAAGIVISLGLVHVLPHGIEEFTNLAVHVQVNPFYNPAGVYDMKSL
jgi:hypothetical protein